MSDMEWYDWTAIALMTVGAINWGVIGVTGTDYILQTVGNALARTIYTIVGAAGIFGIGRLIYAA